MIFPPLKDNEPYLVHLTSLNHIHNARLILYDLCYYFPISSKEGL